MDTSGIRAEIARLESVVSEAAGARQKIRHLNHLIVLYGGKLPEGELADGDEGQSVQPSNHARAGGTIGGKKDDQMHPCPVKGCVKQMKGVRGATRHVHAAHPEFSEKKLDQLREQFREELAAS